MQRASISSGRQVWAEKESLSATIDGTGANAVTLNQKKPFCFEGRLRLGGWVKKEKSVRGKLNRDIEAPGGGSGCERVRAAIKNSTLGEKKTSRTRGTCRNR